VARAAPGFGNSPSAGVELAPLENGATSMPTAVFYNAEDGTRQFGRAAIAAYVDGHEGRLMRSIKSILGSDLMDEATELPNGLQLRYVDVVVAYLRHVKQQAEAHWKSPLERVVIGRPVFFVDDDPKRDARAQDTLFRAARASGIAEVQFQFEPIAAALDYESRLQPADGERLVLVADIGGGTSTSLWCAPARRPMQRSTGALTCSRTMACTWRAPTSTARSISRRSCRCWATAAMDRAAGRCRRRSTSTWPRGI